MTAKIENGELVVRIPMEDPPKPSKSSGKTLVVATSHGNVETEVNGIRDRNKLMLRMRSRYQIQPGKGSLPQSERD